LFWPPQNPLEQEGTYQLPEAQLDRFMLKLNVDLSQQDEERQILDLMGTSAPNFSVQGVASPEMIVRLSRHCEPSFYR